MGNATASLDPRASLGAWTTGMMGMYVADIGAIPEDKWSGSLGGCARPASEITAEVASTLDWATDALKGTARAGDERQLISEYQGRCATREGAIAEMRRAAPAFVEALSQADDATLNKVVMAPWGLEAPLLSLAHVISSHIWYHDGQLNFMQCLLGDGKYHWSGD